MNQAIYTFSKTLNSMQASARIMHFVSELLGIDMVCAGEGINRRGPLDLLVIVNGAYQYAGTKGLESLGEAIESANKIVWIQNDYTIRPPKHEGTAESPFRKAFRNRHARGQEPVHFWTTIPDMLPLSSSRPVSAMGYVCGRFSDYVNWNALTMEVEPPPPRVPTVATDALVYYGAFRRERERHFDQWFDAPPFDVVISTQQVAKFEERWEDPLVIDTVEDLQGFLRSTGAMGLYLEDGRSHRQYHSPANRFYEMLSAGMPMVFDSSCWKTMNRAGFPIKDYHTEKPFDVREMLERASEIAADQRERWWDRAVEDHKRIAGQVTELYERVVKS